jgi:hydrogenase maturation factor
VSDVAPHQEAATEVVEPYSAQIDTQGTQQRVVTDEVIVPFKRGGYVIAHTGDTLTVVDGVVTLVETAEGAHIEIEPPAVEPPPEE